MRNVLQKRQVGPVAATAVRAALTVATIVCCVISGCGSSSPAGGADSSADRPADSAGGGSDTRATGGSGGAGGGAGAGGSGGTGGSGGAGGGPQGGQPLGAVCANTGNCNQATGAAVCCVNTCLLSDECPNNNYVACDPAPTYACRNGRCCRAVAGGQTIHYCTKSNGCSGTFVP